MICFEILSDFWRKLQKGNRQTRAPTSHCREPKPRHSLMISAQKVQF